MKRIQRTAEYSSAFMTFLVLPILFLICSCSDELPVAVNGTVTHAISGERLSEATIHIKTISCSGFEPQFCRPKWLSEETEEEGVFEFEFSQKCDAELYAEFIEDENNFRNRRFIYSDRSRADENLSCNEYPVIAAGNDYTFDIVFQPLLYIDIYAVDDPLLELELFTFQGESIAIDPAVSFQRRIKLDLASFTGELECVQYYLNAQTKWDVLSFDYYESDELTYEVRY